MASRQQPIQTQDVFRLGVLILMNGEYPGAHFRSEDFAKNPISAEFHPDDHRHDVRAGYDSTPS